MRYALRNIRRLKGRSFLSFMMALIIVFLSMFSLLTMFLSRDNKEKFYGPLDGSYHVTDGEYAPFLSYDAAQWLQENTDAIDKVSAVKKAIVYIPNMEYVGYGTFKRNRFPGEDVPIGEKANYIEGFMLCGVTEMAMLPEVYSGDLVMAEGTPITRSNTEKHHNKIVISDEMAKRNHLQLGDTLTLDMLAMYRDERCAMGYYNEEKDSYSYTIGGIYHSRVDQFGTVVKPWLLNSNQIYVPITTLTDISHMERTQSLYQATEIEIDGQHYQLSNALTENPMIVPDSLYFHLANGVDVHDFSEKLNALGMLKPVVLTGYLSDAMTSPSVRLSEMMIFLLIGVVTVGFAVFLFSLLFNLKARHRELAVLAALGKKRSRISLSFFLEIAVVAAVAFLLDMGLIVLTVSLLARPLAEYLYSAEISAKFTNETADMFLKDKELQQLVMDDMQDVAFLIKEYALPAIVFSLLILAVLLLAVYGFIGVYVKRINALSEVGGKE